MGSESVTTLPQWPLHLSDDNQFMSDLAGDRTHTGQVLGSDSSIHDSDCDVLVNSPISKTDSSGHTVTKNVSRIRTFVRQCQVSQQVINMQKLSQLKSLGRRLDDMEAKNCKKTVIKQKLNQK